MKKKILILGAGFLQTFAIRKAKEMGYYTIAIDLNPDSEGFKYADEFAVINIVDKELCLEYAREKKIDGVITVATDYGVISAAYISEKMKLSGLKYDVAKIIKNKYKVRKILFENNVDDIKQFYEVMSESDINEIHNKVEFPVMVKPCDGSGSKGARKVNTREEFCEACNEAISSSLVGKALIEDFIYGKEFGVESFVENGEIHILSVMEKTMTNEPYYAELGHSIGKEISCEKKIREVVCKAIKSLGINFGSVNMDILLTQDNKVCIIDVGARMGGNLIGSHIIPLGTGIEYMENIIRGAVKDNIDLTQKHEKNKVSTRLLALKPGIIKCLPDFQEIEEKYGVKIYHKLIVGGRIRNYCNNLDGMGYVVAIDDDIYKAEERAEMAKELVDNNIIRA